jgi:hypothetical protein
LDARVSRAGFAAAGVVATVTGREGAFFTARGIRRAGFAAFDGFACRPCLAFGLARRAVWAFRAARLAALVRWARRAPAFGRVFEVRPRVRFAAAVRFRPVEPCLAARFFAIAV